jgi:bifunctional non-homologous end joining protein LigD
VIVGYLPSGTSKKAVGSLVMGVYDAGKLVHVGRVGTGFNAETATSLYKALSPIEVTASSFTDKIPAMASRGVKWVKPELVAEVELRGWTHDGMIPVRWCGKPQSKRRLAMPETLRPSREPG